MAKIDYAVEGTLTLEALPEEIMTGGRKNSKDLNFKVSDEFHQEFADVAHLRGKKMTDVLHEMYALYINAFKLNAALKKTSDLRKEVTSLAR